MFNGLLTGKLLKNPTPKTASNGNPYASCLIAIPNDGEPVVANGIAFDSETVAKILTLHKGDAISAVGSVKVGTYLAKDGATKPSISIKVDAVLSAYEVQKRKKLQTETEQSPYVLSNKAVSAMQEAGRISKANDLTVADLKDDVPF